MIPPDCIEYVEARRAMFCPKADLPPCTLDPTEEQIWQALSPFAGTGMGRQRRTHGGVSYLVTIEGATCYLKASDRGFGLHVEEWAGKVGGAPEVLMTDTSRYLVPFDFQIQRAAPGLPLTEFADSETEMRAALTQIAPTVRALHGTRLKGYGPLDPRPLFADQPSRGLFDSWGAYLITRLDEHVETLHIAGIVDAEDAGIIRAQLARWPEPEAVLLHNDLSNANLFGMPVQLIDFGDAIAGDPLFDLAGWCAFHMPDRWPSIMAGYGKELIGEDSNLFWRYYLRIVLARTVHRLNTGIKDDPQYPPAANRIQIALSNL